MTARAVNGQKDNRHHISIFNFLIRRYPRFAELNAANFQPYWAWADKFITGLTIRNWVKRSQWLYPIKSLLDSGALVVFGSDWFVSSGNPLLGIETAITREIHLPTRASHFSITSALTK